MKDIHDTSMVQSEGEENFNKIDLHKVPTLYVFSFPSFSIKRNIFRKKIPVILVFAFECKNVIFLKLKHLMQYLTSLYQVYVLKTFNIPPKAELADFLSSFLTPDRKQKKKSSGAV